MSLIQQATKLTDAEYFAAAGVSQSMLKCVAANKMREYEALYVTGELDAKEPTRSMELGTAIHGVCLEGKAFSDCLRVIPDSCLKKDGSINPKPTGEFRDSLPEGCAAVKQKEYDAAVRSVDRLMKKIGPLLDRPEVQRELAIFWQHGTLTRKAKLDIVVPLSDYVLVIDIKGTGDASPDAFWRTAKAMKYWLQESQYRTAALEHFRMRVDFAFLAVEKEPDSLGQVAEYHMEPGTRADADEAVDRHLTRLEAAYEANDFSDDWEKQVNWIKYPGYVFTEREST